jgi:hypothetical protein
MRMAAIALYMLGKASHLSLGCRGCVIYRLTLYRGVALYREVELKLFWHLPIVLDFLLYD